MRDFAQVKGNGTITYDIAQMALKALNIDQYGLDEIDNKILTTIIDKFRGGPVGVSTIATAIGEDGGTVEEVYEPFLIMEGFIKRTPRAEWQRRLPTSISAEIRIQAILCRETCLSEEEREVKNMKIGIFTGTFDPFTIGHQNIAERALPMLTKLVIAVAVSKLKHASEGNLEACGGYQGCFPKECSELVDAEDASGVIAWRWFSYDDLTIDLAHRLGARFLVRGVRSAKDFEYEREQADINKQLGG